MAKAETGEAQDGAECPPSISCGVKPRVSRALCRAIPQRDLKMALRWVSVSGPATSERGSVLESTMVVWKGGAMAAMMARRGSVERSAVGMVRVARAERDVGSVPVMVCVLCVFGLCVVVVVVCSVE